jgi:hypothetical protein
MMSEQKQVERVQSPRQGDAKRPYRTPVLTEYGSVAKLTQGSLTNRSDSTGGGFIKACL